MTDRLLIIPAAGLGSRLGASQPKPLVHVNGRSMLDHLADRYQPFTDRTVVIAHPAFGDRVRAWGDRRGNVSVTEQAAPTGMLDAILLAEPLVVRFAPREVWITWADQIGVLPQTLARLANVMALTPPPALALPTVRRRDPYTHFDRDAEGRLRRFLQRREGDAMPAEGESDMGVFAMTRETFERDLQDYARDVPLGSATGERNFVPFTAWLAQRKPVETFPCTDPMEAIGINTPEDLQQVKAWLRARTRLEG
jgi:bifunctional N-acetylglucosamine-1-phosphate-uridyltransferase/glucosamine-1-phosphate-acetyltransferase GlmU-like protein